MNTFNKLTSTKPSLLKLAYNQERQLAMMDIRSDSLSYAQHQRKPLRFHFKYWHKCRLRACLNALIRVALFGG